MQVFRGQVMRSAVIVGGVLLVVIGNLLCAPLSRADDKPQPPDAKKDAPLKVSDVPAEKLVVPKQGGPKELLRFIHYVDGLHVVFDNEAEGEKFLSQTRTAIIAAADKLIASNPTPDQKVEALKAKLEAYQVLLAVGIPDTLPKALKFAEALKNDKQPILAEMGEAASLDFQMSTVPNSDPKQRKAVIDALAQALKKKPQRFIRFATDLGSMLEELSDGENAVAAYETFGDILSKNLDENVRTLGERMKTGSVRRARLLTGEPLKVSGKTFDGKPFDINEYKGKVVIVDFWATWCGPCLEELPNIKAIYEKYHGKGLEVIGVNLDDDRDDLVKFFKETSLPWKTLNSADPAKKTHGNPVADNYGITLIPAIFVVNRQGKVVSLNARGEQLAQLIASELGEPPAAK